MVSKEIDDLLSLLAAVINADKRVVALDVDVFLKATNILQSTLKIEPTLSEARALLWYEMNKAIVKENVMGPYFKTWLYDRIDGLAHIKDKQAILDAMDELSLADREKNANGRALKILTARRWGL